MQQPSVRTPQDVVLYSVLSLTGFKYISDQWKISVIHNSLLLDMFLKKSKNINDLFNSNKNSVRITLITCFKDRNFFFRFDC